MKVYHLFDNKDEFIGEYVAACHADALDAASKDHNVHYDELRAYFVGYPSPALSTVEEENS